MKNTGNGSKRIKARTHNPYYSLQTQPDEAASSQSQSSKSQELILRHLYDQKDASVERARFYDVQRVKAHWKIKDEIRFLASTFEKIYEMHGTPEKIPKISSQIRNIYKQNGITAYIYVHVHLDERYKDPEEVKIGRQNHPGNNDMLKLFEEEEKQYGGKDLHNNYATEPVQNPEALPREKIPDIWTEKRKQVVALQKQLGDIEEFCDAKGIGLPREYDWTENAKDKPRDKVSYLFSDEPAETIVSQRIHAAADELLVLEKRVIENPPKWDKQRMIECAQGIDAFIHFLRPLTDRKWSMDWFEWWHKENWREWQGKHASATMEKVQTNICRACSKGLEWDPFDFVEMQFNFTEQKWQCPVCHGFEGIWEDMTREQVGDRKTSVQQYAAEIIRHFPAFIQLCFYYREWEQPKRYARKARIRYDLSKRS